MFFNSLLQGIDFSEFTLHLALGIIACLAVAYGLLSLTNCIHYLRLQNKDPPHIAELKREIAIWERTARNMPVVSLEERAVRDALRTKAAEVRHQLLQEVNIRYTHTHTQHNTPTHTHTHIFPPTHPASHTSILHSYLAKIWGPKSTFWGGGEVPGSLRLMCSYLPLLLSPSLS